MNPNWRRDYLRYKSYFLDVIGRYKERADIRAYLEILLSLATISIFAIFALRPTLLTIAELMREIETKRQTLTKMEDKIGNINKAQSLYDRERQKINLLKTSVPGYPDPDVFARQIEGLSVKHQSALLGITMGKAVILGQDITDQQSIGASEEIKEDVIAEGASELSFTLKSAVNIEDYTSIASFISDLEKLRRPIKVDSLTLSTNQEINNKYLLLVVEGRLPYLKAEDK